MDVYDITASALTAQRLRLDVISSNLANVNTTRKADGSLGAYRRRNVVFAPLMDQATQQLGGGGNFAGSVSMQPGSGGISMGPDGKPIFKLGISANNYMAGAGVEVMQIQEDTDTPMRLVYDPSHPDANDEGYVEMPNINVVTEMVDMISATRAYEANVTALQSAKSMNQSALDM